MKNYLLTIYFSHIKMILTKNQDMLLKLVSDCIGWCKSVYAELSPEPNSKARYRKWLKAVSKYYIDILNQTHTDKQSYEDLVWQTASKLESTIEKVSKVFDETRLKSHEILDIKNILDTVPDNTTLYLTAIAGDKEFISLILRYQILCLTEGLFLSLDKEFYFHISRSSKLPVLECYASPLNYNLKQYCSLYPEDRVFGALPRFDEFIDTINFPCRLCINPPYTSGVMKICVNKVIAYMNKYQGEFIITLPVMYKYQPLEDILKYPCTRYALLDAKTYVLHSFLTPKDITATMSLYLAVNVGGSSAESQIMLDNIVCQMKKRSEDIS